MSDNIKRINKVLGDTYGKNLVGEPFFRVIFSDDVLEKRFGRFTDWYGKIFLREYVGLREVPKYGYLPHKWVLERWIPPVYAHTPEIPATKLGSYEPVYVFQDQQGNALSVVEKVIHQIIWNLFHPILPGDRKSQLKTEDETLLNKEIEFNKMVMEDANPYLCGKIHGGEAIVRP